MAEIYKVGNIKGPPGAEGMQGVSVSNAAINSEGHLIVTLSNSNRIDTGYVVGPAGPTGASGKSAYDQAMEGGYAGTEIEFNTAIANLSPMKLVLRYAHTRTGTTHELNGPEGASTISFTATAPYTDGDTYKLNDTVVTAATVDGAALHTGDFVTGQKIIVTINGNKLTFPWRSYESRLDSIDAEMQNKANYINHGATPTDVLSVLGDGTHKCWAWTNTPSNFIDGQAYVTAKDWALKDGVVAYGRRNCSSPYGGPEWENVCANKVWSGWYPIATATPPTEINLSLKTGYVKAAGYKCCFSKAQNGLVVLHLAVGRESGSISAGSQICAVIPVGYRPSEAVGNSTADRSITVSPNGDVSYGTTTATPTLTFTLAFYAL